MGIRYSVRDFGPEIAAAYQRLFPDQVDDRSIAQLAWRFEHGPHGRGLFAVAQDDDGGDKIIGMIALVATRLRMGRKTSQAYQAIDTVVDPAYRGRGVFVGLGKVAQDSALHHGAILWGFPNANAAPGWFGRLGWQDFGTVPFMVRPLRTGYFLRKLWPLLGGIDLPLIRQAKSPCTHRRIERFHEETNSLWSASLPPDRIAVDRDSAWLNWRLMDKPGTSYRTVGAYNPQGALDAFVSTCLLDKHGGRICYFMEAMGSPENQADLALLLRDEVALASQQGAEVALSWCPKGAPSRAAFRRAGFVPLPDAMRPVEIHFGARALVSKTVSAVEDGSKWFISYLDSDTV